MFVEGQSPIQSDTRHLHLLAYRQVDSATVTDVTDDVATFDCFAVLMTSASDLSGFSCRLFCIYHSLMSAVHTARTDGLAAVLLECIAR